MIQAKEIEDAARGKWIGIFESFGIDVGVGKHQPCPVPGCGGRDRFRYTDKTERGDYFCNQCGHDSGLALIKKVTGLPFPEILKRISDVIGFVEMDNVKEKPKVDPKEALNKVWKASTKLTGGDPVSKYLHSRKIILTPDNVRYCPKCWESGSKKEMPAMVARIQNKAGKPISLHRTYLDGDKKAAIECPKRTMPPTEPIIGAAIRLFQPGGMFDAETLGVAEGIETAISAAQLYSIATWSVISTAIMEKFDPPSEFKKITIFADNDANFAGAVAAYNLAKRLYSAGLLVDVIMPPPGDMNDVLQSGEWK